VQACEHKTKVIKGSHSSFVEEDTKLKNSSIIIFFAYIWELSPTFGACKIADIVYMLHWIIIIMIETCWV
jgi:hypothetical protein